MVASCGALLVFGACSDDSDDSEEEREPTILEILGAQNAEGSRYELDDDLVEVSCDPRVTINLGPSPLGSGLLDNWQFRGPGTCGSALQCGFIRAQLLDSEGKVVTEVEQAVLNPVFDLSEVDLERIASVETTLVQGKDLEDYLVDGEPVTASWTVEFSAASGCEGMGGAGGAPSMGGAPPVGGIGGMGGAL